MKIGHFQLDKHKCYFILACRRILYLQTILQRGTEELIYRVYAAQKDNPTQGDFCQLVSDDSHLIDIQLSDSQISNMTRYDLKMLVKSKARRRRRRRCIYISYQ